MLVSLVCVLMLMMAYTQLFSDVGSKVGEARSMIELSTRMRSAAHRLRSDLEAHTCDMKPWQRPEAGAGYFEIIEGPLTDLKPGLSGYSSIFDLSQFPLGDTDDVIMWTVRSKDGPFIGQVGGTTVQSEVAEVIWFLRPTLKDDGKTLVDPPTFTLYRRVLLVMPSQGHIPQSTVNAAPEKYDLSMHTEGSDYVANSLGDLTKRENRAGHASNSLASANGFPHRVDPSKVVPFGGKLASGVYSIDKTSTTYNRYGEDAVLTNVVAFDVQVWDPTAPVKLAGTAPNQTALSPSDPGYAAATTTGPSGAYVDLHYGTTTPPTFAGAGNAKSMLGAIGAAPSSFLKNWMFDDKIVNGLPTYGTYGITPATFDTWSFHYEMDGLDQDGTGGIDQGTDQIVAIQNGSSGYETSPPYPVPLRGVKIRIRCYEPDSRDVREVTVTESFVPQ